jgi:hypothetical protein
MAGSSEDGARDGFPEPGVVAITSILGVHGQQDRPEHRRVTRGREVLLEPRLTPHAEPLPVLPDSEIRAQEMVTHPWRLVSVTDGGRRLVVSVAGQLRLQGMRVSETADEVSIIVYGLPVPLHSLIAFRIVFVAVTLGEPLGERRLIGGAG